MNYVLNLQFTSVSPNSSVMLGQRTSLILLEKLHPFPNRNLQSSVKFRSMVHIISPKFTISSSLGSILGSGNAIAAAAAVAGSTTTVAHAAVTSTITQVAVTAVAIASGACLSTKVDFLWPKLEEQPSSLEVDGVDVTGYPIFSDSKVQKAISFAKNAHDGQWRKTGEPYLTHCIHTGRIIAALVPSSGERAVNTVAAGILHDVVDDTDECLLSVREEFGDDVTKMVAAVSRLSYINQLLRRKRRVNTSVTNISYEEANNLRVMLLGMVDDPRVVLIKLADRLHNMRTIYALPLPKAQAVAQETLVVWCSLASRLGLWALKAELEDLCFAVLQPEMFSQMRAELSFMWSSCRRTGNLRRVSAKSSLFPSLDGSSSSNSESSLPIYEDEISMKDLLQAVLPFDLLLDRRKRINFLDSMMTCNNSQIRPQIVRDAGIALESLAVCEEALEKELLISTSYVPGMEVTLSSRLKSLYSIYSKMKRKDVGINKVYDARALRVIIGDKNGSLHGSAVTSCYSILDIVHRIWSPIDGELDDYIVNPKPSGYQSLHTAVQGPDNAPLEVQIRTQRMHKDAEHGNAAHWLYKETEGRPLSTRSMGYTGPSNFPRRLEDGNPMADDVFQKYTSLRAGHPVLRVEGSHLLAAVIISVGKGGRELLVAVSFGLSAYEEVAERRTSSQIQRWEAYARLYKKVSDEWWFEPGHGDWSICLEKYTLCRDGIYHKQDQFDRLLPTFIQIIHLTAKEETEYWGIVSAVVEDRDVETIASNSQIVHRSFSDSISAASTESNINRKVQLLRTMLQWEEQLFSEVGIKQNSRSGKSLAPADTVDLDLGEVAVVSWPHGNIIRLKTGSTAADAARRVGSESKLVWVNGQPVQPNTELKDGDVVEVKL